MVKPPGKEHQQGLGSEVGSKSISERLRVTAVLAVALAVAVLVWLLFIKGDGDTSEPAGEPGTAAKTISLVPESQLLGALKGVGYPVYWAGPRLEVEYEVSRLPEGQTYVRYLPDGEEVETKTPFLTIGSYKQPDALAAIRKLGQTPGSVLVDIAGGGSAYAEGPEATSAYLAFPKVDTEIEVYDPRGGRALKLARSGAIVPVG